MTTSALLSRSVRSAVVAFMATCAALIVLLPGTAAEAKPSPAEVEKQINTLWGQAEPLIEQYNKVHTSLQQNKTKLDKLKQQIGPLQLQVDLSSSQVGSLSADLYMRGPGSTVNALLSAGSPAVFADQMITLNYLAQQQNKAVQATRDKVAQYNEQRKPLEALTNQLSIQDADLAAKKKTINDKINQLQKLRTEVYGTAKATAHMPVPCPYTAVSGARASVLAYACAQGYAARMYSWGKSGPTYFDCSGLTMRAWQQAGIYLDHNAQDQYDHMGSHPSESSLRPGDLVFFGGSSSSIYHVGMYIGGGWIIHAPQTGEPVQEAKMADVGSNRYYGRP